MADFDLSMAIIADGDDAAREVELVDSRVQDLNESSKRSDEQNKRTTKSAADLAKQQRATAEAINAVTRATNPAVGSQRALDAALRKAESAYISGRISAGAYARAQEIAGKATFAATNSIRNQQQGVRQLGLQFNDFGTQVAAGINPLTAFIQQTGQIGYAMSQMEGKAKSVGNFLAGGWGALILVGVAVLGNFISKLIEARNEGDRLTEAQKIQKMSLTELSDAIDKNNEALGKSIKTGREAEQQALDEAEARRRRVVEIRKETVALLEQAQARFTASEDIRQQQGTPAEIAARTLGAMADIRSLQAQLAGAQDALRRAEQGVALARVPLARRDAKAATDPSAKIQADYDRAVALATTEFTEHGHNLEKLNAALRAAEIAQQKATKDLQDSNRKPRTVSLGDQVSAQLGQEILAAAQGHVGETERNQTLKSFLGGQHIDPEKEAWCAAFINAVLASKGVTGTGSNAARSFLGFGQATESPQKGDIVVLKSGRSPSGTHVGFFAGEQDGRIQVTGGNQGGGKVTTSSFAKSSVLGFRRVPTAAETFADEERLAQKTQKDVEQLAAFGEQAAQQIGALANRAMNTGTVQQANAQLAQLDKVMAEVEKRKPPNLEDLRRNAAEARTEIQDGIMKPFDDFLKAQQQSLQLDQLKAAGLEAEAEALQEIYRQEAAIGKELLPDEIAKIYQTVVARRAVTEEIKRSQEAQREYLRDLDQYKDVFRTLFSGNPKDVTNFPARIFDVFKQQAGDKLFDQLFGPIFKQLEGEATGANKVKAANLRLAASGDRAADALLRVAGAADGTDPLAPLPDTGEQVAQGISQSPLGGILTKIGKGIGMSDESIAKLSGTVTKGLQGAATGAMVQGFLQPLGKMLGIKTSSTGAQIGGAIGSFIPIPGGDIIGAVIGSVVGGLFKKTKKGSVTLTGSGGAIDVGSAIGNNSSAMKAAEGLAGSVQGAIQQIAEALGGQIGAFSVSIGTRHGDIRVDPSGGGRTKISAGAVDFNDDEAAAIRFAVMDAIRDGAVTGLSQAVQRALNSSPDIDKALREALKVKDLETLLQGVGGQIGRVFSDFETIAAERVRLARTYGLDLVKTEELNAKERANVFDQVMQQRIGDLKQFLDDLKFGDLFEGTALERRNALLEQVAKVRQDADQGIEGAASQLAALERQLIGFSRETFGTAGPEFAADRAAAQADAERIIAAETQRAREAQERATAQLNAATTQNQLANETNNLLAQANSYLSRIAGGGAALPFGVGGSGGTGGQFERATDLV